MRVVKTFGYVVKYDDVSITIYTPTKPLGRYTIELSANKEDLVGIDNADDFDVRAFELLVDDTGFINCWKRIKVSNVLSVRTAVAILSGGKVLCKDGNTYSVIEYTKYDGGNLLIETIARNMIVNSENSIEVLTDSQTVYGIFSYRYPDEYLIGDTMIKYLNKFPRYSLSHLGIDNLEDIIAKYDV